MLSLTLPVDDIFLHSELLGGNPDCLLLVSCLAPLLASYGSYFPVELGWALAQQVQPANARLLHADQRTRPTS